MEKQPSGITVVTIDKLSAVIDQLGAEHNMRRERPHTGQPWTSGGIRGNVLVSGLTMRDIRDCYIRAYVLSHSSFTEDSVTRQQPNATLVEEATKGENAVLCVNDVYDLVGSVDPVAVAQNLLCEIEKMMGIFPNIDVNTSKDIMKSLFGDKGSDNQT